MSWVRILWIGGQLHYRGEIYEEEQQIMIPLVTEMVAAAALSMAELRQRITNVRYGREEDSEILFEFESQSRSSRMVGRNADLVLGMSPEADAAIALRCFLDEE